MCKALSGKNKPMVSKSTCDISNLSANRLVTVHDKQTELERKGCNDPLRQRRSMGRDFVFSPWGYVVKSRDLFDCGDLEKGEG